MPLFLSPRRLLFGIDRGSVRLSELGCGGQSLDSGSRVSEAGILTLLLDAFNPWLRSRVSRSGMFLLPFREIGQALHAGFRRLSLSTLGSPCQQRFSICHAVFRDGRLNLGGFLGISSPVIVAFVVGLLSLCPLTIRNDAATPSAGFTADAFALFTAPGSKFRICRIACREFVAANAMRFRGLPTAPHVHELGDGLQMVGIDASRNPAKMVQYQPSRNRTPEPLPGQNVSQPMPSREAQAAIAIFIQAPNPKPASGRSENERVESLLNRATVGSVNDWVRPESAPASGQVAPPNILPVTARFDMVGIDALRNSTFMIQGQIVSDRTMNQFVSEPMSVEMAASVIELAVAKFILASDPEPAGCGFENPRIKSFIERQRARHSLNQYATGPAAMEWAASTWSTKA